MVHALSSDWCSACRYLAARCLWLACSWAGNWLAAAMIWLTTSGRTPSDLGAVADGYPLSAFVVCSSRSRPCTVSGSVICIRCSPFGDYHWLYAYWSCWCGLYIQPRGTAFYPPKMSKGEEMSNLASLFVYLEDQPLLWLSRWPSIWQPCRYKVFIGIWRC